MERPRKPTLDTVARALGVSRATVSNAYNRPDQLSSALRERILATAGELGYTGPDPVARSLVTGRSAAVAFLLASGMSKAFSDPALSLLLDALAAALEVHDHSLVLLPGAGDGPRPERLERVHADLAIAYGLPDDAPALTAARRRGLPLIVIDQPAVEAPAALVAIDDLGGAQAAARHLVDLGHRAIGVLALPLSPDGHRGPVDARRRSAARYRMVRDRLSGYLGPLADAGPDTEKLPVWESPDSRRESGREGARRLLEQQPRPTALLCMSDELAIGALEAARDLGLSVPSDLSVVGFDDIPAAAEVHPRLTTVRQPLTEKGQLVGRLALALLGGARPDPPARLNAELVVRSTTTGPSSVRE